MPHAQGSIMHAGGSVPHAQGTMKRAKASMAHAGIYNARERIDPIFSTVLSQNSKLLVIAQLHPHSTEHLMSNMHLHNTLQHALCKSRSHLCIAILKSRILHTPTTTTTTTDHRCCSIGNRLGSTTFRFGSEHERKMSLIDPATEHAAHV